MSEDINDIDPPDNDDDGTEIEEEDFATLFESYTKAMEENFNVGDKGTGRSLSIGEDAVFIDTGGKIDGFVEKAELLDDQNGMPYQTGDEIELYVVSMNESEIRLSRALSQPVTGIQKLPAPAL